MTQDNSIPNSLVNWKEAKLFAKRVGNENPIWAVFPPKINGGPCLHFPSTGPFIPTWEIEMCLKENPKHSLGMVVNPYKTKPPHFGEFEDDLTPQGNVRTWGVRNKDIGGSRVLFFEGDAGLDYKKQMDIVDELFGDDLQPGMIVKTGGKSLHFYWLIEDVCLLPNYSRELQKKLEKYVRNNAPEMGVDKSTHSPCQIMRVPGYKHGVTGNPSTFFQDVGEDWTTPIEKIESFFNEVETEQPTIPVQKPTVKNSPGETRRSFISEEAIQKESGWFSRLAEYKQRPLAVEMLGYVVKRDVTGEGQRNDCISILCGLLNFFGEEETISIVNEAKWQSPFWNPVTEVKSIYPPYQNEIGCLVWQAKKGQGPKWIYENSPVINGDTSGIKLEDVFPAELSRHLRVICKYLPFPDYLIISSFLSAVASCLRLGTSAVLSESTNFVVPLNLFVGAVGRTGSMKSPMIEQLIKQPLQLVEEEVNQKYKRQLAQWLNDKNDNNSNDGELPEPVQSFVFIRDTTEASMERQLVNQEINNDSLLVLRDELSALFVFDKEKGNKGTQKEQYLELFDGNGLGSIRMDRGKAVVRKSNKTQVSIAGAIQDQILAKLIAFGDPTGLFARFLFLPLPSIAIKLGKLNEQEKQASREARKYLKEFLLKIKRLHGFTYYLDNESEDRFIEYHFEHQVKANQVEINSKISHAAVFGKSAAKVGRLTGLIHIVRTVDDPKEFVQEDTLDQAIKIVDFSDKYTIEFEKRNNASSEDKLMKRLIQITSKTRGHMAYRDISAGLTPKERGKWDKEMIEKTLQKLAHMGYGDIKGGSKGAIYFKKLKDWE